MFNLFGKKTAGSAPDFSAVDSIEKAEVMAARGELEALLLLPEAFGGTSDQINVVYVPAGVGAVKARTDQNVIAPLAAKGTITRYSASPRYQGSSVVPIAIDVTATEPGSFSMTLKIWGDGLKEA